MKEDFFEWLNSCPVGWTLGEVDRDGNRDYTFYNAEDDDPENEEDEQD